jgi:DNA modification methylase
MGDQLHSGLLVKYLQDPDVTLYSGDALEVLRTLPDRSVHMCATSPPFYGLRDYGMPVTRTLGWRPSCSCGIAYLDRLETGAPVPATILDPFAGSGTTLLVARKLGRRAIGIELNEEYCKLASDRLSQQSLFAMEEA